MSTLPPSPPADLPRVFVGGLTAGISNEALHALLSKFGAPQALHRAPSLAFAHVSLDTPTVERCIAALHNTTWCGVSLRVQRAREHFAARMRREWALLNTVPEERQAGDETGPADAQRPPPFEGASKGRHTRFEFVDAEQTPFLSEVAPGDDDVPDGDNARHERRDTTGADENKREKLQTSPDSRKRRGKPAMGKSQVLNSTMQLFGISEEAVAANMAQAATDGGHLRETHIAGPVAKRSRRSSASGMDYAEAVQRDPAKFDAEAEKETARAVLKSLFPAKSREELVAAVRRIGLFRKLPVAERSADEPCRTALRLGPKAAGGRRPSVKRKGPDLGRRAESSVRNETLSVPKSTGYRRAGLYRKLVQNA